MKLTTGPAPSVIRTPRHLQSKVPRFGNVFDVPVDYTGSNGPIQVVIIRRPRQHVPGKLDPDDVEFIKSRKSLLSRVFLGSIAATLFFGLPRFTLIEPLKYLDRKGVDVPYLRPVKVAGKVLDYVYSALEKPLANEGFLLYREDETARWVTREGREFDPRDDLGVPYEKFVWSPIPGEK